ncbi:helix-hairpin-helix domain-containing protein [Candidatus Dependentiae bacterium]|nr:helix-hairpin-helix domain-containing protein [Candidatus Dependentiae bacterium]
MKINKKSIAVLIVSFVIGFNQFLISGELKKNDFEKIGKMLDNAKNCVNLDEKLEILLEIIKIEPSNIDANRELGIAYFLKNDTEKSDYYLTQAVLISGNQGKTSASESDENKNKIEEEEALKKTEQKNISVEEKKAESVKIEKTEIQDKRQEQIAENSKKHKAQDINKNYEFEGTDELNAIKEQVENKMTERLPEWLKPVEKFKEGENEKIINSETEKKNSGESGRIIKDIIVESKNNGKMQGGTSVTSDKNSENNDQVLDIITKIQQDRTMLKDNGSDIRIKDIIIEQPDISEHGKIIPLPPLPEHKLQNEVPGYNYENGIAVPQNIIIDNKLNLNTVTEKELASVAGLTEMDKTVLIKYREDYGYFSRLDDLKKIPGISGKYDQIKDYFYIGQPDYTAPGSPAYENQSQSSVLPSVKVQKNDIQISLPVNINKSDMLELQSALGISELESTMILKYIERYGTLKNKDEFRNIPIIGKKYDLLKDRFDVK